MLDVFTNPPRFESGSLDVRVAPTDPGSRHAERLSHLVLRVFTSDPFEDERQDHEWMFAGNRLEPEHRLVVNISFGHAEIAAEQSSWDAVLTEAVGRAMALWEAHPDLVEAGPLATRSVAGLLPEPIEVGELEFDTTGWAASNFAIAMDMAEVETGHRAWERIVSEPLEPDTAEDGCPGCAGELLRLVDVTAETLASLCSFHQDQQGKDQAAMAASGEGFRAAGSIMFASMPMPGNPIASGFLARTSQAWDSNVETALDLLDWIVAAFAGHAETFELLLDANYEFDAVFESIHQVAGEDAQTALRFVERLADMAGAEHRWLFEIASLDCYMRLDRQADAYAIVDAWLEQAESRPHLYMPAADYLLDWGRYEDCVPPLWRLYGHGVVKGNETDVTYALSHLARAYSELGRDAEAEDVRSRRAQVDDRGAAALRPGRNEPCPCRSGRKTKHCCGRPGHR